MARGLMRLSGIVLRDWEVRAFLAGTKRQLRRAVAPQPELGEGGGSWYPAPPRQPAHQARYYANEEQLRAGLAGVFSPWKVGDRLWGRETWSHSALGVYPCPRAWYRADFTKHDDPAKDTLHIPGCAGNSADCFPCAARREGPFRWWPSVHMRRADSRITLLVESLRVERLHDITEEDARAEGCTDDADPLWRPSSADPDSGGSPSCRSSFERLWRETNGAESWNANPYLRVASVSLIRE